MATYSVVCFCLIFVGFCFDYGGCVHEMRQNDACSSVEGTWRLTDKNGVENYFLVKKKDDWNWILYITASASVDFNQIDLPIRIISKEQRDGKVIVQANVEDLIGDVSSIENIDDELHDAQCKVTLKRGAILTKVATIKKVNLIYMNHLDVGYATNHLYPGTQTYIPGFILNVLNLYFQVYFPRAARLADELRKLAANETFIYTTHPWLVNLYLDCPKISLSGVTLQCPSEAEMETFRRAVLMGDIAWHAGPFNIEPESSNAELFSYGLALSRTLDDYFGLKKTGRTASNRDVPGWTKAAIPYLVKNNIAALSIGVNPFSAPPDVPSPNVWTFQNQSIITYWHKGGYPVKPGPSPQNPGGLSRKDCQFVNNLDQVLCFAFRDDNTGPPENVTEIKNYYKILKYQFPGAEIKAATFEDFTNLLIPLKSTFPVVTKEIGDTWIQGPASDPIKMAHYRAISRLRSQCLIYRQCDLNDPRIHEMSRFLLKLPEHTYGLSDGLDQRHWSNTDFQPLQHQQSNFVNDTKSWMSHRYFNDLAYLALKDHPLAKLIEEEFEKMKPYIPNFANLTWHDSSKPLMCKNGMVLKIAKDGGLEQMKDKQGREWADVNNTLAKIMYRTYNSSDFVDMINVYSYDGRPVGIWKPGLNTYTNAQSRFWSSPMRSVLVSNNTDDICSEIYVRIITLDAEAWWTYGAPSEYLIKYSAIGDSVDIEYQFYNKPSTRMPDSLLLNFQPTFSKDHRWYVHKVGYFVDPTEVVNNGSQYVHAVDKGVAYFDDKQTGMFIESVDVATVLVQTESREPSPIPTPLKPFNDSITGMAFNIYNNVWETNFIFWYPYQPDDKHFKARFRLSFT